MIAYPDTRRFWLTRASTTLAVRYISQCFGGRDKCANRKAVLLEAPFDPLRRQMNSVLLTVDLTKAVADEAIERNDSIVIAYRTYGRE